MRTIGFVISKKKNEKRRSLTLSDIKKINNREYLYFEEGYGNLLGYSDDDIENLGCHVLTKNDIYKCDVIVDPKIGDSDELKKLENKIVFGWIHATQNYEIAQCFIDNKLTGYAWEKMFDGKRHIFEKNNQIAGKSALLHAMLLYGSTFHNLSIAILGNGNTSKGVQKVLNDFHINYKVYHHEEENVFKQEFIKYDIVINCILWNPLRKNHIINKSDLMKMKKGSMIIDISCDRNGAIETSKPTTIDNPIYIVDNIIHYAVDHTPSLLYKEATESISNEVCKYIDDLILSRSNDILDNSLIIKNGIVIDDEISLFQNR